MSDTTLYSSLYQQISDYAEQVDEVLVALVTKRRDPAMFYQMAETLRQIVEPAEGHLANRMIAEMILTDEIVGRSDLEIAADALETNLIDETTRDIIDRLARSLEQERTKTMARIRGERR